MKIPEIFILENGTWDNPQKSVKTSPRFVFRYEIEYQKNACGTTTINGTAFPIESDVLIFSRPADMRSSVFNADSKVETEFVYLKISEEENEFINILNRIPNYLKADKIIKEKWQRFFELCNKEPNELCELEKHLEILSLLIHISKYGQKDSQAKNLTSSKQTKLFKAIQYMRMNLCENVSVSDIASHIGYSESYFCHLFKIYTHKTPYSYYIKLKIDKSRELLLRTNKNISQISNELGFGKTSQFTKMFKRECVMTPKEFKKSKEASFYYI